MVRLRLPLSIAVVIRLLILLAIFVPSSPIKIWPSLVSFASMPSSSTTRVNQARIIALRLNNDRLYTDTKFLVSRWLGIFFLLCGCLVVNMLQQETTSHRSLLYWRVWLSEWLRTTGCYLTSKPVACRYFQSIHATEIEMKPVLSWFLQVFNSRKLYPPISLWRAMWLFNIKTNTKWEKKSRVTNLGRVFKTWSWIL